MDSARMRRRISSPPQLPSTQSSFQASPNAFDDTAEHDAFEPDASPSRKQKLLNNRNSRFPGKKLSLTGISSKFNQLIGKNEQTGNSTASSRDQENNTLYKSKSTGTIGKKGGLNIPVEKTTLGKSQSLRRRQDVPIHQDYADRPGQSSPFVSSPYIDPRGEFTSPLGFDHVHDNLNDMRLRELSLNVDWSPTTKSPPLKSKHLKRPASIPFDTDDYIEHIEKELQQTRDEAYSPLTRRPVREKLRVANKENERLQKELAQLRERFETEVKKTVEHKTLAELELKRKVRDLEGLLEEREYTIRELQYQHEERRLDNNVITSLKATIDRLERDKSDMEQINLGMSERNDVLTQLLAMSPTKVTDGFQLRSPVRERRSARPISLILPRQTVSPCGSQYVNIRSHNESPRALNSADISPFKLSPDQDLPSSSRGLSQRALTTPQQESTDPMDRLPSPVHQTRSRRSTLHSDISASSAGGGLIGAFINDEKTQIRRKARRYMAGSTQLKPLLLPLLASEGITPTSASTASSPRSWKSRVPSDIDIDDTIMANEMSQDFTRPDGDVSETVDVSHSATYRTIEDGPGPAYSMQHTTGPSDFYPPRDVYPSETAGESELISNTVLNEPMELQSCPAEVQSCGPELSVEHLKLHDFQYSLHTMPIPETPESLIALPQPLFSANRNVAAEVARLPSGSPCNPSEYWQVNVQKKRKHSFGTYDTLFPATKIQCSRQLEHPPTNLTISQISCGPTVSSSATSASKRLSQIRSTDNIMDLLRQKNFAARPLAALTIRTVYTLLSTCTTAVRGFRQDPFALARRVLANAWRANWKVLGKVSWWVLGLFIRPGTKSKVRAPIDWDHYDAESIASRYCSSTSQHSDLGTGRPEREEDGASEDISRSREHDDSPDLEVAEQGIPGWGRSMYLWGKFSAALMLAVSGAVIKGPSEMLREADTSKVCKEGQQKSCKGRSQRDEHTEQNPDYRVASRSPQYPVRIIPLTPDTAETAYASDFDFRYQLGSSSLLEQIQQPDCDSTLRPDPSQRGRLGSLFSPTPSPGELVMRMQDLRLSSAEFHPN